MPQYIPMQFFAQQWWKSCCCDLLHTYSKWFAAKLTFLIFQYLENAQNAKDKLF